MATDAVSVLGQLWLAIRLFVRGHAHVTCEQTNSQTNKQTHQTSSCLATSLCRRGMPGITVPRRVWIWIERAVYMAEPVK